MTGSAVLVHTGSRKRIRYAESANIAEHIGHELSISRKTTFTVGVASPLTLM